MRLARRVRAGMVHVNDQTIGHEAHAPIGGMGASGNGGRFGALSNLDEFTQWQWITLQDEAPLYAFRLPKTEAPVG